MKRALIYLRVSTAEQTKKDLDQEGLSIPAQREACQRKAEALEAEVVAEFTDRGESARSVDRDQLQAMLAFLSEHRDIDYVIVHKIDRLARSRPDDVQITLALRQAGATLVSVSENIDETPSGQLLHGIVAAVAEFYSRNLATETLKGCTQKAKVGGTPYRAPLGYLNVRELIDGREVRTVTEDPERAPLVQLAFELYATGDWTLISLLDELTRRGLRTRPSETHAGKLLGISNLADLLHNPYYKGVVRYRGAEYQGRHQPLVDPRLFDRVQSILRAHDLSGEKQRVHHHYLKGSVFCGRCGARLCLTNAKGQYLYFFCSGRHRRSGCSQPYVLADKVEEAICRFYATIQLEPQRVELVREGVRHQFAKLEQRSSRELNRQQRRLARLRDERTKLLRAHLADAVPLDLLKTEQARISAETTQAEQLLEAAQLEFTGIEEALEEALELAASCQAAYELAAPKIRRQFNQAFFQKILVTDQDVTGAELAPPFAQLLAHDLHERLEREMANPELASASRGSNHEYLVPPARIELAHAV